MFENVAEIKNVYMNCYSTPWIQCGDEKENFIVDGIQKLFHYMPDKTTYHRPTFNGKHVNRQDFCKLFHHDKVVEVVRGLHSVVLKLDKSVTDSSELDTGKRLQIVMRQVNVPAAARRRDGHVDWRWLYKTLPCYREIPNWKEGGCVIPEPGDD